MPPVPVYPVLMGQVALVTGASKGLGQAIAIALGAAGARVLVNYHGDEEGARQTVETIRGAGSAAMTFRADVAVESDVESMFAAALEEYGRLDICVPNSGIQLNAPVDEMTLAQWQRVIDVNLTGQFLCARAAVRQFKRQGIDRSISAAAGKIIFMSSVHDLIPWEGHVNYASAKGGIMLLMKSIAQETAALRIRSNAVSPGAIRTPMNVEKLTTPELFQSSLLKLIPYGRIGEPEDVGHAVVWLASDASDYVTGTTIYIDGGMTLYPGFIGAG
jgi:glucose 1-dehydrogenase